MAKPQHHVFSMFPPDVLARDFIPVDPELLNEMATSWPTLKRTIERGEYAKLWQIAGRLYSRRTDLEAYRARINAALLESALS
jgi:hypothetical protein